jgi:hypothetical protein
MLKVMGIVTIVVILLNSGIIFTNDNHQVQINSEKAKQVTSEILEETKHAVGIEKS